jgi:hypothetical protein
MASSDKTSSEAAGDYVLSSKSPKELFLGYLAEIQDTLEKIHQTQMETDKIRSETGEVLSRLTDEADRGIRIREEELARTRAETEALRAKLSAT